MKNSKFTISQHAIDRYIARIAPGTNWEKARHTLERRVRHAKRCHGHNPRQRYKSNHDSTRYYQHHDLVFVVDIDTYTVVTIFRRAWLYSNNTATPIDLSPALVPDHEPAQPHEASLRNHPRVEVEAFRSNHPQQPTPHGGANNTLHGGRRQYKSSGQNISAVGRIALKRWEHPAP